MKLGHHIYTLRLLIRRSYWCVEIPPQRCEKAQGFGPKLPDRLMEFPQKFSAGRETNHQRVVGEISM